jgi:excisionase family DNA binding protein
MGDPLSGLPMLANPKQAAEVAGPTEAQVRGLIRAGRIAYVMVGTRRMIPAQQLKISSRKTRCASAV